MVLLGPLGLSGKSFRHAVSRFCRVLPPLFRYVDGLVCFMWVGCGNNMGEWGFVGLARFISKWFVRTFWCEYGVHV